MLSLIFTLPPREMSYYFVSNKGRARSVLQVATVREVPISAENHSGFASNIDQSFGVANAHGPRYHRPRVTPFGALEFGRAPAFEG